MQKFKVRLGSAILDTYFVSDGDRNYMHRDGEIVYDACEYWPTEEEAQAVLDKYQPEHVWEHGDVFRSPYLSGKTMLYVDRHDGRSNICICFDGFNYCNGEHLAALCVVDATFLFNIKDKLGDS